MDAICLPSFVPLLFFPGAVAWASPIDTPEPCLVPQREPAYRKTAMLRRHRISDLNLGTRRGWTSGQ
jgi:hypothetical protein